MSAQPDLDRTARDRDPLQYNDDGSLDLYLSRRRSRIELAPCAGGADRHHFAPLWPATSSPRWTMEPAAAAPGLMRLGQLPNPVTVRRGVRWFPTVLEDIPGLATLCLGNITERRTTSFLRERRP